MMRKVGREQARRRNPVRQARLPWLLGSFVTIIARCVGQIGDAPDTSEPEPDQQELDAKAPHATLTISPKPVPAYGPYSGNGCGYVVGKPVDVAITGPMKSSLSVTVSASGCISFGT